MISDERQALKEMANLLPPGYVKVVPFETQKDVTFEFRGVTVRVSSLYLNEIMDCYLFDLSWGATDVIYGIPIRSGVDILAQYTTPLPNLYSSNTSFPTADVSSWRQLLLFVIDESVLENV